MYIYIYAQYVQYTIWALLTEEWTFDRTPRAQLPGGWRLRPNNQTGIGVGLTHGSCVRDCENMRNLK